MILLCWHSNSPTGSRFIFDMNFTISGFRILHGTIMMKPVKDVSPKHIIKEIMKMKRVICTVLCLLMALSLAACGQKAEPAATTAAPAAAPAATEAPAASEAPAAPAKLSGTVSTDGSTSMEKVIGALGEAFMEAEPGVTFTYNPTGSGSGIQAVQEGRCDIGLSSRALKDEEKAAGLTETILCYDGIAIIVNPANKVENLTIAQIADIYTGKITNWSEVGGDDSEIVLIGREAGSGTRSGFEEIVEVKDLCKYRQELSSTGDVITTVAQNPGAIGYASLASVKDTVKAVKVGGVTPSEATVKDGTYAIQRPFVLATKTDAKLNDVAQAFFDYVTSPDANDVITAAGVVPAN